MPLKEGFLNLLLHFCLLPVALAKKQGPKRYCCSDLYSCILLWHFTLAFYSCILLLHLMQSKCAKQMCKANVQIRIKNPKVTTSVIKTICSGPCFFGAGLTFTVRPLLLRCGSCFCAKGNREQATGNRANVLTLIIKIQTMNSKCEQQM